MNQTSKRGPEAEPVISEEDLASLSTGEEETPLRASERINQGFLIFGGVLVVTATAFILGLIVTSVVLRYFFNSSLPLAAEGPTYFFPWLIAGGAIVAMAQKSHVAVDALVERLHGKAHDRAQIAIWGFSTLVLGYLTYLAAYLIGPLSAVSTPIMGWPNLGSFAAFILMAAVMTIQAALRTYAYTCGGAPHNSDSYDSVVRPGNAGHAEAKGE